MSDTIMMLDEMPSLPRTPQYNESARELLVLLAFLGRHENIERVVRAMKGDESDSTATTTATSEALGAGPGIARDTGRI